MTDRATMLKRAALMRREPTEPEKRLWRALSNAQLGGHKFRRQMTIGHRIVDFFCPAKGLIVEVDGDTHDRENDLRRDKLMEQEYGYTIIRYTNEDVMTNLDGVLLHLQGELERRADRWRGRTTPNPSSEEEGL